MKTITIGFFLMLLILPALYASVSLEVGTDILVETDGSVFVEIDSTLIETGTGYFKGKISSGSRTGMTEFAGLSLSAGINGTIIRTTGAAYTKGNGEGINFKRYYEVNNTGGSMVTANMQISYVSSGSNDERNGLTGPYFVYRYISDWTGYGDGSSSSPVSGAGVQIPKGMSDWVISEGVRVATKVFLEGPYDTGTDQMSTYLGSYLPTTSPYAEDARTVASVPTGVTDWVLVQLRSTATGVILGARSCFLKADGNIVADDGATTFIDIKVKPGDYYVVIRHRNHLAVMTASVITGLTWGVTPSTYDFTTASDKYYGYDGAKELESGVWGMIAGDGNGDGGVYAEDYTLYKANQGYEGYHAADYNMDSGVYSDDYTIKKRNQGSETNVP